jgi:hypothetical protein
VFHLWPKIFFSDAVGFKNLHFTEFVSVKCFCRKKKAFVVSLFGGGATFSCLRQDVFSAHNTVLKYISWQQLTKINPTT